MTRVEKALYSVAMMPFGLLWSALILVQLWAWFAVPLGAPALAYGPALGLLLLVRFLVLTERPDDEDGEDRLAWIGERIARLFGVPALYLVFGWLVQLFL